MFAAGPGQPVRYQREDSFRERLTVAQELGGSIQDGAQGKGVKQVAGDAHGAPGPGLGRGDFFAGHPGGILLIRLQQSHQRVQVRGQKIFASDVQDHALADLVALAVVLHQAEVFVPAVGGFDRAKEHGALLYYTTNIP